MINEGREIGLAKQLKTAKEIIDKLRQMNWIVTDKGNAHSKGNLIWLVPADNKLPAKYSKVAKGKYKRIVLNLKTGEAKLKVSDYPDGFNAETYKFEVDGVSPISPTVVELCRKLRHATQRNDRIDNADELPDETISLRGIVDKKYKNKEFERLSNKYYELLKKYKETKDPKIETEIKDTLKKKNELAKKLSKLVDAGKDGLRKTKARNAWIVKDNYFNY